MPNDLNGFGDAPSPSPAPAAPSSAPAAAPSTPYQRDVQRTDAGRAEIARTRTDADATRAVARGEQPPPSAPATPGSDPAVDNAIDAAGLRSGERIRLVGPDGKQFTLDAAAVANLREQHAADLARRANLPVDANGYKVELPADFQVPPGSEIKIDTNNPAWADARAWAHRNGISQAEFSALAGVYAGQEARQQAQITAARNAEVAKLGVNASQRIEAVHTWWNAMTGDDGAVLGQILRMAPTAGTVQSLERLMQKFSSQGAAPFNQGHREAGGPPDQVAGWDKMTYEQRRFAQDQRAGRVR